MHSLYLRWRTLSRPEQVLVAISTICFIVLIFFRVYKLTFPAKQVFDEVYFPVFAKNYLTHTQFFDVHPPMGKLCIALGMLIFGDNYLGWRIIPLLAGVAILWLMFHMGKKLTGSWLIGLFASLFVAADGMFLVYSRTGLMDGVLYLATMAVFAFALCTKDRWLWLSLGLSLGVAVAIKWPAAAIIVPVVWVIFQRKAWWQILYAIPIAIIVYLGIVYLGELLTREPNPFSHMWWWHDQALGYHERLTDTHPYGSPWWSWPLMKRPVLFLYDGLPDGRVQLITTLANPVLIWSSTLAVVASLVVLIRKFLHDWRMAISHPLVPLLLGYFSAWLPWAFIKRVAFLYHYLPAYGFALMILAYCLAWVWRRDRVVATSFLVVLAVATIVYMPWWVGWMPVEVNPLRGLLYKGWIF